MRTIRKIAVFLKRILLMFKEKMKKYKKIKKTLAK